jgi:hypothetical protein
VSGGSFAGGSDAGPTIIAKYRKIPRFRETQKYVKRITGFLGEAKREAARAAE